MVPVDDGNELLQDDLHKRVHLSAHLGRSRSALGQRQPPYRGISQCKGRRMLAVNAPHDSKSRRDRATEQMQAGLGSTREGGSVGRRALVGWVHGWVGGWMRGSVGHRDGEAATCAPKGRACTLTAISPSAQDALLQTETFSGSS